MSITMEELSKSGDRPVHELDEVEVTPRMIEVGVKACLPFVGNDTFEDLLEEGLAKAYLAMRNARTICPCEG